MERLTPFLVGGPAFSGTTLLALLLNQPGIVCLDEPDFEDPAQAHRNLPVLRRLFPQAVLPPAPERALDLSEAFELVRTCAGAVQPTRLGFKTCNDKFVAFARLFRDAGLPVVAIVRDIRDALARPLPRWQNEQSMNAAYRRVWENLGATRAWVRYEDLVRDPGRTMARVGEALRCPLEVRTTWSGEDVPDSFLKDERHELLCSGAISSERVGRWRDADVSFSPDTIATARMMGYVA